MLNAVILEKKKKQIELTKFLCVQVFFISGIYGNRNRNRVLEKLLQFSTTYKLGSRIAHSSNCKHFQSQFIFFLNFTSWTASIQLRFYL